MLDIEVIGAKKVLVDIGQLGRRFDDGPLGRVYHIGARDPETGEDYAPFVQNEALQADIHRGYWQTDQDVINSRSDDVRREFEVVVNAFALGGRLNLDRAVRKALVLLYNDLRDYPPPRRYIRTQRLKRGWRWQVI